MGSVLVIDDDQALCELLASQVSKLGYETRVAYTIEDGKREVEAGDYDVVMLDVCLPDGNGLDIIGELRAAHSTPEVIIITAAGNEEGIKMALERGAWDYIEKPSSFAKILMPLTVAMKYRHQKDDRPQREIRREGIKGSSYHTMALLKLVGEAADTDFNVLVSGETGTGKELVAKAIHSNSARCGNNFIVVDCGSLHETLIESILFGHEKGSYTGADRIERGPDPNGRQGHALPG